LLHRIRATEKPRSDDTLALIQIAGAACYSPNPRSPLGFDLPFDLHTGELNRKVFARWLANDPVRMIEQGRHARALKSLRLLFLDCGTRDEWALHLGMRMLVRRLRERRIDCISEEFDDNHMSISYRYNRSLPLMARALARRAD
jgi:enterochelin esterase family protein